MGQKKVIQVEVQNKLGIHARPAGLFVETASRFKNCEISVANGKSHANGKSLMGMMMLVAHKGTVLTLTATGEESDAALSALKELLDSKFGEEDC